MLLWCLPALLVGAALRLALSLHLPFAYFHDDAPDFFATPFLLLRDGEFILHTKKTWLVPTIFTVPFLTGMPAMIAIPIFLHLLGLVIIGLAGVLCSLWFRCWRWFIIPLTLIMAVNPFMLWYERTIMAETIYIACTLFVAVAGTQYALRPNIARFAWLIVALFLLAGARPEGKLVFGFGLLLVFLVHVRHWQAEKSILAVALPLMALVGLASHFLNKTSQAGLLLYTSVARFTPTEFKCAPGIEPYLGPIRDDLQRRWAERPNYPAVRDRKYIAERVRDYLIEKGWDGKPSHREVNEFCMKLASETCRRNFAKLPGHSLQKFRYVANEMPSGTFDNAFLFEKQREAWMDPIERVLPFSRKLVGRDLANAEELNRFVDTSYGEVRWFNTLAHEWLKRVNSIRLPDEIFRTKPPYIYRGVPLYFLLGLAGLLLVMTRGGALQPLHIAWGLTLLGLFFVIMVTGNVRPRFRIVFEPFWFIYIGLLIDVIVSWFLPRPKAPAIAAATPSLA